MTLLGTPVTRVEDARLLQGGGRFVANIDLPGALHVGYVTSTLAHGRLRSIDTAAARALDGITDVVTAADLDIGPLAPMLPSAPKAMARCASSGPKPIKCSRTSSVAVPPIACRVTKAIWN